MNASRAKNEPCGRIIFIADDYNYTVSKKLCKIVFVRTSSNFHQLDNFWQKDGKKG